MNFDNFHVRGNLKSFVPISYGLMTHLGWYSGEKKGNATFESS